MFQAIFRTVLVLLILAASHVTAAFASENRVALVIGNSAYRHASVLDNPKNDAADIAAAAEKLGFKVIKGLDLDKSGMDRTIRQFAGALKGASVGMFFYAGHGLQVGGRNYLVPIDAELKTPEALDFEMVGLDVIQRAMESATETNVLFIDACRDNPLSRNLARAMGTRSGAIGRGLVAQEAGSGTLISYSTQPGNVALDSSGGRNSPYAAALAKHITTQGKDLPATLVLVRRDVMAATGKRQVPWEHSALTAELTLAPQAPAQAPPPSNTTAPKPDASARNASDGASSAPEPKTAMNQTPEPKKTSEPEVKPEAPKQRVVKIGVTSGKLKIINNKNNQFLYNEAGKISIDAQTSGNYIGAMPTNRSLELPPGRYYIRNGGGLVTINPFEIKAGEDVIVDFLIYTGTLRVINTDNNQFLYNEAGKISIDSHTGGNYIGAIPKKNVLELPPGRYQLKNGSDLVTAEFEIKAGEEAVLDFGG